MRVFVGMDAEGAEDSECSFFFGASRSGMPESRSHGSRSFQGCHPWRLDSGFPAGMTKALNSPCGSPACHRQRRLMHCFAQGRMRVARCARGLRPSPGIPSRRRFGTSSDTFGPNRCTPRMRSVSAWAMHLDLARRFRSSPLRDRSPRTGKLPVLYGMPSALQFFFGLAGPGDFRFGVDHPGNGVVVDVPGLAGDQLGDGDAFLECPCARAWGRARSRRSPRRLRRRSSNARRRRCGRDRRVSRRCLRRAGLWSLRARPTETSNLSTMIVCSPFASA